MPDSRLVQKQIVVASMPLHTCGRRSGACERTSMVSLQSSCATTGTFGHMMTSCTACLPREAVVLFISTRSDGGAGAHGSATSLPDGDTNLSPPKQPAAVSSVRVRGDATMRSNYAAPH